MLSVGAGGAWRWGQCRESAGSDQVAVLLLHRPASLVSWVEQDAGVRRQVLTGLPQLLQLEHALAGSKDRHSPAEPILDPGLIRSHQSRAPLDRPRCFEVELAPDEGEGTGPHVDHAAVVDVASTPAHPERVIDHLLQR